MPPAADSPVGGSKTAQLRRRWARAGGGGRGEARGPATTSGRRRGKHAPLDPPSLFRLVSCALHALPSPLIGSAAPSVTCSLWASRSLREALLEARLGRGWLGPGARFVYCSANRALARASVATAGKGTSSGTEGGGGEKVKVQEEAGAP